ncbi:retinal pigment epithelial membrane protein [Xylona heveae TC161]|uniref:Retinal pigment epithelial membrane protein n=1 Tax=Xylona heveae (strain CBS 132557 / TC161) TaxID=1328760 RepID=A0A165AH48_XYLHT|nr:retinal pigment epithelial membrane protein [Xylona heveae TC161]KZF20462.1 retinal pigment epithelial membrane protein [Xylona heveae TC161]
MSSESSGKNEKGIHPHLSGNHAPVQRTFSLTPCAFQGKIPKELAGGQYIRNGGNPVTNTELDRDAHWFDGDGMLCGVAFQRLPGEDDGIQPEFVNQFILTDVYLSTVENKFLKKPLLPSLSTIISPLSSLVQISAAFLRSITLILISRLPGSQTAVERVSVANTALAYHDGRALATCESGPPIRFTLPGLETVGWYNGLTVDGEVAGQQRTSFGGGGISSFFKEWTTAHPHVDPKTKEMILIHMGFAAPFLRYSIIPADVLNSTSAALIGSPVDGIAAPTLMHSFGVSPTHTVIMDLPLSLDPRNLLKNKTVAHFDWNKKSRFGIFPRHNPSAIRWCETEGCCVFHTANTWDNDAAAINDSPKPTVVNLLLCRLTSAAFVFTAGSVPEPQRPAGTAADLEGEQDRLYYYCFSLSNSSCEAIITHQWALSVIPFEFPILNEEYNMSNARYIYGTSVFGSTFGVALGKGVKIDALVKMDTHTLIESGKSMDITPVTGSVDTRSIYEIIASTNPDDPIKVFAMPEGWYAQECRFVSRSNPASEDDGWLLTYVFDESQLDQNGSCPESSASELWIIDARGMKEVVARIHLPQRVPYGFHGYWYSEEDILNQRPADSFRKRPIVIDQVDEKGVPAEENGSIAWNAWMAVRCSLLRILS